MKATTLRRLKVGVFILALQPLAWLGYRAIAGGLGANPVETVTRALGDWALRLLLLTLACTPLRRLTGQAWPLALRRMLGLFAFFYTTLHLLSYLVLDQFLYWPDIWADILKRPYITIGMGAWLLLVPLAATSNRRAIRRLGRNWQRLHRLVYPIAVLAVLHFFLLVKADVREPLVYGAALALLLLLRLLLPGGRGR